MVEKKDKVILTAVALGAGLVSVGIGVQSVDADTVDSSTEANVLVAETKEQAQINLDNAKAEESKVREMIDTTKSDVEKAQDEVDKAQINFENAKREVDKVQLLKDEATKENIENVNQDIVKAQDEVTQATDNIAKINETVQTVKEQVENKETEVENAKREVDRAQVESDRAQIDVDNAQAALEGTNKKEALENLEKANDKVEETMKDLSEKSIQINSLESQVGNAQAALDGIYTQDIENQVKIIQEQVASDELELQHRKEIQQQIKAAKDKADEAVRTFQREIDTKQTEANKARNRVNETEQALKLIEIERDTASEKVSVISAKLNDLDTNDKLDSDNTIVLPEGYGKGRSIDDFQQFKDKGYKLNIFKHNEADKQRMVNPIRLTTEEQKEISLWIADILNPLMEENANSKNIVTESSLKYAQFVADNYWDTWDHDIKTLDKANEVVGGVWFNAESIGKNYIQINKEISIDELKEGIYNCMLDMIFDDGPTWGHALHLTGLLSNSYEGRMTAPYKYPSTVRFGFSIDKNGVFHFETYTPEKDDSVEYSNSNETSTLKAQLAAAQKDLSVKQRAFDTANTANNKAKDALTKAIADLATAKNNLYINRAEQEKTTVALNTANINVEKAMAKLIDSKEQAKLAQDALDNLNMEVKTKLADLANAQDALEKANKAVEVAKEKLANDIIAQKEAQKVVDSFSEDVKTKQINLDNAKKVLVEKNTTLERKKKVLAEKRADLQKFQDVLNSIKNTLAKEKEAEKKARTQVKSLESKLASYLNVDDNLVKSKLALSNAQDTLEKAKKQLTSATQVYTQILSFLSIKQAEIKTAQAILNKFESQEKWKEAIEEAEKKAREITNKKANDTYFYSVNGKFIDSEGNEAKGLIVKSDKLFDSQGNYIGKITQQPITRLMKQAVIKESSFLPKTGDNSSESITLLGVILVILSGILGPGALNKRKQRATYKR